MSRFSWLQILEHHWWQSFLVFLRLYGEFLEVAKARPAFFDISHGDDESHEVIRKLFVNLLTFWNYLCIYHRTGEGLFQRFLGTLPQAPRAVQGEVWKPLVYQLCISFQVCNCRRFWRSGTLKSAGLRDRDERFLLPENASASYASKRLPRAVNSAKYECIIVRACCVSILYDNSLFR